jgi:serine/threonine-protein kinase
LPYVRADWFIATAVRPPLYHAMLDLPATAHELERRLEVDVVADFLQNRLARAGFATSGVSGQNRLVDRHGAKFGAYWKSYDFKSNDGAGDIFTHPLGPTFDGNPFERFAFAHDGGEIIFNLPNGLQGYLLVDAAGRRIDFGPTEVVSDSLKTSGNPAIVNGLSCMGCHKHGVIRFEDALMKAPALSGPALEKLKQLVLPPDRMNALLAEDETRFLAALEASVGRWLKVGSDKDKSIRDFPEPIGAVARLYLKDPGLREVACELGIDPDKAMTRLERHRRLQEMGLGPLFGGKTISRQTWHSFTKSSSLFQKTALELELGVPYREL